MRQADLDPSLSDASASSEDEASSSESESELATPGVALLDVPLGERARAAADGSAHASGRRHAGGQPGSKRPRDADSQEDPGKGPAKRASKHAPVEERISRRPVSVVRDAVQRRGAHHLDPRFLPDPKSGGAADGGAALKRYSFLFSERMPAEVRELKRELKACTDVREHKRLQVRLSKLQQTLKQHEDRSLTEEVEKEWRDKERAAVAHGKGAFHLKASEKRKLVLAKKFERLEAAGKLEGFMEKRRKRAAAKDRKRLPFQTR